MDPWEVSRLFYIGTSGFSYKEWVGTFYPRAITPQSMLPFYSQHFLTTEINNTFYRMPSESMLKKWNEQAKEGFRFAIKARKLITTTHGLTPPHDYLHTFLSRLEVLSNRIGAVLFLFPPGKGSLEELEMLIEAVHFWSPSGLPFQPVIEVRQPPQELQVIRQRLETAGWALCFNDEFTDWRALDDSVNSSYIRLRNGPYTEKALENMAHWIDERCDKAKDSYIYFRHSPEAPLQAAYFHRVMQSFQD